MIVIALTIILSGCSIISESQSPQGKPKVVMATNNIAQVLKVEVTGQSNNYTLAVTISSPDTGCDRYADWWEVITPEGELLYWAS